MDPLLEIVVLTSIVLAVYAASRRFHLLTPIALVIAGILVSAIPGTPSVHLEPDFVLIGILPPLLYVAALEISVPAFKYNLRPILLLSIGLVLFTAIVIGLVVHALLPDVPLSACFALGGVVAPPDAVAATAIARRIGLPRRTVTILEGESLLNDATAIVIFRVAILAAIGQAAGAAEIGRQAVIAVGGGLLIGAIGAVVMGFLHKKTTDPLLDNSLSLLTPFAVTAAADAIHASAVVAVVITGLYLGHRLPTLMSAASRLQMGAFWAMVKFLLEGAVFLLVGLQLRDVVSNLQTPADQVVVITIIVVLAVILTRFVWMYPATYLPRLIPWIGRRDPAPHWSVPTVISWAGMRGVVTLATALALPAFLAQGASYPRELFVWLAFAVIIATLLLQGMTLPSVARMLKIKPDDPMQDILAEAATQNAASRAAVERLDAAADGAPPQVVERLRTLATSRNNSAWERLGGGEETPSQAYIRLRREMLAAEREVFREARDNGRIAEEILVRAQRELDLEESMLERSEA